MSDNEAEMRIDPARAKALVAQLQSVSERIAAVAKGRNVHTRQDPAYALIPLTPVLIHGEL